MKIQEKFTRALGRKVLQTKKNSPHIFFAAGVVGVGVSTVMACRATLRLEAALDESLKEIEEVKTTNALDISDKERNRLLALKYGRCGVKLAKLYGPSVLVGSASIALLAGSHIQLTRRNSALTATLTLLSKSFDDYRERVKSEVGDERENEIYRGIEVKELDQDGKKKKMTVLGENGMSIYARRFDAQSTVNWHPSLELNRAFLQLQQNYFNHMLQARGHVMLNDVYDALGFDRTTPGAIVGWVYNNEKGDNFIDFGIYTMSENIPFMFGEEYDVWLDFNVDGVVFDMIDKVVR